MPNSDFEGELCWALGLLCSTVFVFDLVRASYISLFGSLAESLWVNQTHPTHLLQTPGATITTIPHIPPQRTHRRARRRPQPPRRRPQSPQPRPRRAWIRLSPRPGPTVVLAVSPTPRRAPERRRRRTDHSSRKRRHSTFQVSTRTLASLLPASGSLPLSPLRRSRSPTSTGAHESHHRAS